VSQFILSGGFQPVFSTGKSLTFWCFLKIKKKGKNCEKYYRNWQKKREKWLKTAKIIME